MVLVSCKKVNQKIGVGTGGNHFSSSRPQHVHMCCVIGAKQTTVQTPPVPFTGSFILEKLHLSFKVGTLTVMRSCCKDKIR